MIREVWLAKSVVINIVLGLPWWARTEFQSIAIWLSKFFLRVLIFSSFIKVTPSLLHWLVLLCSWITHGPYGSSLRHLTFAFQPESCHVAILFIDLFSFVCFVLSMQSRKFFFCFFIIYVEISMWRRWHFKRHCCLGNDHMFCIWRTECTNKNSVNNTTWKSYSWTSLFVGKLNYGASFIRIPFSLFPPQHFYLFEVLFPNIYLKKYKEFVLVKMCVNTLFCCLHGVFVNSVGLLGYFYGSCSLERCLIG